MLFYVLRRMLFIITVPNALLRSPPTHYTQDIVPVVIDDNFMNTQIVGENSMLPHFTRRFILQARRYDLVIEMFPGLDPLYIVKVRLFCISIKYVFFADTLSILLCQFMLIIYFMNTQIVGENSMLPHFTRRFIL